MMMNTLEKYREAFDYAFLGHCKLLEEEVRALFEEAGIGGFTDLLNERKLHGNLSHSQKSIQDLTKLSFSLYGNLNNLPLKRQVILPKESGEYKFIVSGFSPFSSFLGKMPEGFETNDIVLLSNKKGFHRDILKDIGFEGEGEMGVVNQTEVFGGGWLKLNHEEKTILAHLSSGDFDSCSNEMVERMLEGHRNQGYEVSVDLQSQRNFYKE